MRAHSEQEKKRVLMGLFDYQTSKDGETQGTLWLSGEVELTPTNGNHSEAPSIPYSLWQSLKNGQATRGGLMTLIGHLKDLFVRGCEWEQYIDMMSIPVLCIHTNDQGLIADSWIITITIDGGFDSSSRGELIASIGEAISHAEQYRSLNTNQTVH